MEAKYFTYIHALDAALPELVTATDLLAIVPQLYARAMARRGVLR